MKKIIAVVGDATIDPKGDKFRLAAELGKALVDNGYRVQTGGRAGVMEAAFIGAKSSPKYTGNDTIAINPFWNKSAVNPYADIIINTGLDLYRNTIVVNADAVIAVGGGAGTLSEMANAWTIGKLILAFNNVDGWSSKVADTPLDHRKRYKNIPDDRVYGIKNAQEAIEILQKNLPKYESVFRGIVDKN